MRAAHTRYPDAAKRGLDLLLVGISAPLWLPLLGALFLLTLARMGRPVLFRQWRPGRHGRPFRMVKFRTMRETMDASGKPLPDQERLTPFGRFLRSSSLDELPEILNVIRGDMSLVGPRPLLMEYLPLYSAEQSRRHEVKPGITGWAQVNGRNVLSWVQKFALDVWYVDHRSLPLDLRILLLTALRVLRRQGIAHAGEATMPRFKGAPAAASANPPWRGQEPVVGEPRIRGTIAGDRPDLKALYEAAFPDESLVPLVERLLAEEPGILSLAAMIGDQLVGHILLTPCNVAGSKRRVALLGPLAVAPCRQKQGIGGALVREGFNRLGRTDLRQVLVLGDHAYYGRFGFQPERSIVPPYELPKEWSDAWQSVNLEGDRKPLAGTLRPPAAWLSPSLWAP